MTLRLQLLKKLYATRGASDDWSDLLEESPDWKEAIEQYTGRELTPNEHQEYVASLLRNDN